MNDKARPLSEEKGTRLHETSRALLMHPRFSSELALQLRRDERNVERAISALEREFFPDSNGAGMSPWGISVTETINRVLRAAEEMDWQPPGVALTIRSSKYWRDEMDRLALSAPAWPKDPAHIRCINISWGEGKSNVTLRNHIERLRHAFGLAHLDERLAGDAPKVMAWCSESEKVPKIEWRILDIQAYRKRASVAAARDWKAAGTALLSMAWQFPELTRSMDLEAIPGMFVPNYAVEMDDEMTLPGQNRPTKHHGVPFIKWQPEGCGGRAGLCIGVGSAFSATPDFSVPQHHIG